MVPVSKRRGVRVLSVALSACLLAGIVGFASPALAFVTTSEVEPNGTAAAANPLPVDGTIALASISPLGDEDYYALALTAGQTYIIESGPDTANLGTNYDVVCSLFAPDGTTQVDYDDDGGAANFFRIEYTPPVTGTYYARVRAWSHGSTTGQYGVRVYDEAVGLGGATISGTVTDGAEPLEGIEVTAWVVDAWFAVLEPGFDVLGDETVTAADGTYTLTVPPGISRVEFTDPSSAYYGEWYDDQPDWESATVLDLEDEESAGDVDAALELIPPIDTLVEWSELVSVDENGEPGLTDGEGIQYHGSRTPAISADGSTVVFYTRGWLTEDDENYEQDWFAKDLATGEVELVSVATDGTQADNAYSEGDGSASVSGNGRFVAFDSPASTLVDDDSGEYGDVFLRDREDGTTIRVSVGIEGEANGRSNDPAISRDGRYIAFDSQADNLVEDDYNNVRDVFVYDTEDGSIEMVSLDAEGAQGTRGSRSAAISADGRYVAFVTGNAFDQDDENGEPEVGQDVYVKDMETGAIELVSISSEGNQIESYADAPSISGDGRFVAFYSGSAWLVGDDDNGLDDVFLRDRSEGTTIRVSGVTNAGDEVSDGGSWDPVVSDDGRFVSYTTGSDDLVVGDGNGLADVVVHDVAGGTTTAVSVSVGGTAADGWSRNAAMSADGSLIAYDSYATNVVLDDENEARDVFVAMMPRDEVSGGEFAGENRYETALEISRANWEDEGAEVVVIATGENWPDALGGSALAGVYGAPVLLTRKAALPDGVAAEIDRLGASRAFVLGGPAAVSAGVEAQLAGLLGAGNVVRIGGANRYRTAELVADEVVGELGEAYDGTCFVATGMTFADALSAAPLAAANGWPVYLAGHPVISPETLAAMQGVGVTDALLLGGEAAMPQGTEVTILELGIEVARIDGADRYETAAKVAAYGVSDAGLGWNGVAFTTGEFFPDALAGGPAQGLKGSVMLLTPSQRLSGYCAAAITANKAQISEVRYLGDDSALSYEVRDQIEELLFDF